jgi:hypothetical protein
MTFGKVNLSALGLPQGTVHVKEVSKIGSQWCLQSSQKVLPMMG